MLWWIIPQLNPLAKRKETHVRTISWWQTKCPTETPTTKFIHWMMMMIFCQGWIVSFFHSCARKITSTGHFIFWSGWLQLASYRNELHRFEVHLFTLKSKFLEINYNLFHRKLNIKGCDNMSDIGVKGFCVGAAPYPTSECFGLHKSLISLCAMRTAITQ
jgi:hypothetical protein